MPPGAMIHRQQQQRIITPAMLLMELLLVAGAVVSSGSFVVPSTTSLLLSRTPPPHPARRRTNENAAPPPPRLAGEEEDPGGSNNNNIAASLDPASRRAEAVLCRELGLTARQTESARRLVGLVCDWNDKINLVSRKDCRPDTVMARHVLPSLAYEEAGSDEGGRRSLFAAGGGGGEEEGSTGDATTTPRVLDAGTGGGFPGLPLAIRYPDASFVLADSVGKKIAAVSDMAQRLGLTNVKTYHGRVEDYFALTTKGGEPKLFDVVTGRSVTALPRFCAWIQHLLKEDGHLVYWTGGDIEETLLSKTIQNTAIQERLPAWQDDHDKRILVFPAAAVREIAAASGVAVKPPTASGKPSSKRQQEKKKTRRARGAWRKKSPDEPRQRGYENFQRYSSTPTTTSSSRSGDGTSE